LYKERAEWKKIAEKAKNSKCVVTPVKEEEEECLYKCTLDYLREFHNVPRGHQSGHCIMGMNE